MVDVLHVLNSRCQQLMENGHVTNKFVVIGILLFCLMGSVRNASPILRNMEINVMQNFAKNMRNNFPAANVRNVKIMKLFPLTAHSASSSIVSQGKSFYRVGDAKIAITIKNQTGAKENVFCHFVLMVTI